MTNQVNLPPADTNAEKYARGILVEATRKHPAFRTNPAANVVFLQKTYKGSWINTLKKFTGGGKNAKK